MTPPDPRLEAREKRVSLTEKERNILATLVSREWSSHTTVTPAVREHLDEIEVLARKLAPDPEAVSDG